MGGDLKTLLQMLAICSSDTSDLIMYALPTVLIHSWLSAYGWSS